MTDAQTKSFQRETFRYFTQVPTRWSDADPLGHINNAMLVRFIECGRIDYFLQEFNVQPNPENEDGYILANYQIAFISQLHYPAKVDVGTRVSRLGGSSFDVEAAIFLEKESGPLLKATATCVWYDFQLKSSKLIPDTLRDKLIKFEEGTIA
jgi:acyl-CoA thioester hydrolase